MELDYFVVDVFTDTAFAGNPLAVVMNTVGLATEQMQAIAREFNLSETTLVKRRPEAVEQAEGDTCRHLHHAGGVELCRTSHAGNGQRTQTPRARNTRGRYCNAPAQRGPGAGGFLGQPGNSQGLFGEMTQPDAEFGAELDCREVARLTGLNHDDLDSALPPQIVSTGTAFAIVALRSDEPLTRLNVDSRRPRRGCARAARAGSMFWGRPAARR